MTHASAEQLYDLERQVRALAEEVDAARTIIPDLRRRIECHRALLHEFFHGDPSLFSAKASWVHAAGQLLAEDDAKNMGDKA